MTRRPTCSKWWRTAQPSQRSSPRSYRSIFGTKHSATRPSPTPHSIGSLNIRTASNSPETRVANAPHHQVRAASSDRSESKSSLPICTTALHYDEREGGELRGPDLTTASAATRLSVSLRRVRKLRIGCPKTPEYAFRPIEARWY
jgi:hypothetical protein